MIVVIGWMIEGVLAGVWTRLWLVIWTLPIPLLYLRRVLRRAA
ncbi:hypothetical protein [Tropicimonas isoalkanivorans]|nr:hypothetical protein [Tropicimonas isoalkanivorans]